MLRTEELEDAADRVWRAEERRVDVEPVEVVQRRAWQDVLDLPIAGAHRQSGGEVRYLTFSHNFRSELVIESIKRKSRREKGSA
jgi:hypothetical protein